VIQHILCMYDVVRKLQAIGISTDAIITTALDLYQPYGISPQQAHNELATIIHQEMKDGTISSLISAAIYLDTAGTITETSESSTPLYSPAIIGTAIAESIGGSYAYFEYTRFSQKSPGILCTASPFLHEALAGLMAGCTSRLYSVALPVEE